MPAPALIGAIVRGVAQAGGQAFASQAARTAATTAAKGAGQAAVTGAEGAATQAPGFVLQHAPDNAKAITAALRGFAPSASNTAATATQASVAAPQAAPMTAPPTPQAGPMPAQAPKLPGNLSELGKPTPAVPGSDTAKGAAEAAKKAGAESAANAPEPAPKPTETKPEWPGLGGKFSKSVPAEQGAKTAASGATPPPTPPSGPTAPAPPSPQPPGKPNGPQAPKAPTPPAPTAAQQAAQPNKPSFLERAGKMTEKAHEAYTSAKEKIDYVRNLDFLRSKKSKSVDEETRGMSLEQRYKRLEQSGTLLSPQQVAKASGVAFPSQQDVVGASEKAEQQQREHADAERARSEGSGAKAAKAAGGTILAAAMLPVALPLLLAKTAKHLEAWGTGVLESSRSLQRFDASIARTFARLEHQNLQLQMRTAQATGGSASTLGRQLGDLRRELQPFRENVAVAMNLAASSLVVIARVALEVSKWSPFVHAAAAFLRWYEGEQRKKNPSGKDAYDEFFGEVSRGNFSRPKNPRPSEDRK